MPDSNPTIASAQAPSEPACEQPRGIGKAFENQVPLSQKLAFGPGGAAEDLMNNSVNTLFNPVFNLSLGVNPGLLGIAQALPRFWDAIFGPLVGGLSDNTRTRWGRRKPFMVVGAVLATVSFAALWWVPSSWGTNALFIYATAALLIFYSSATIFQVPWNALGLALSTDTHERTRVMTFRQYFALPVGFMLPWFFWVIERDCFKDRIEGVRILSFGIAAMILIAALIPAIFCRETYDENIRTQQRVPLIQGFLASFRNPPFVVLILMVLSILVGLFLVDTLGLYVMIFHVYHGDTARASAMQGWAGTAYKASALLFLPAVAGLSARFGKRRVLASAILVAFLGTSSKWWCYTPANPWLSLIPAILMGPGLTAMFVLTSSLLGDVCDYDEWLTSCRREAMYSAVFGWCVKLGLTGAFMLSGFVLTVTGFNQTLGAAQSPATILWMRFLFSSIPPASLLIALALTLRFPLTQSRLESIRKEIDARKAAANS